MCCSIFLLLSKNCCCFNREKTTKKGETPKVETPLYIE